VESLQDVLEGASRPGHFRGVCTVVLKLLNIVTPDAAYFGQKDAQQVIVLRRMVGDLNVPVELRVCPTVREADGLALSSRNGYLDPTQRRHAAALGQALREAAALVRTGERDAGAVHRALTDRLSTVPGATLDYAAVVAADSLRPLTRLEGTVLVALAVRFGATRLIDNVVLAVSEHEASEVSL
jgi:pantoate--beta-alanine ligase